MVDMGIKSEMEKLAKDLNEIQRKQIPFAISKGINEVLKKGVSAHKKEIKKVFDKPNPLTRLYSIHWVKARKNKLSGFLYLNDWVAKGNAPEKYLKAQIEGGDRALKGFERLLQAQGVLPKGYYIVPAKKAKRNTYGNLMPGRLNQVLSYFQAQRDPIVNTKRGRKRQQKAKFIVREPRGGMPGGIWRVDKQGNAYPYLIFVKRVRYKSRYDFDEVSTNVFSKHWQREARKALRFALKTAK